MPILIPQHNELLDVRSVEGHWLEGLVCRQHKDAGVINASQSSKLEFRCIRPGTGGGSKVILKIGILGTVRHDTVPFSLLR